MITKCMQIEVKEALLLNIPSNSDMSSSNQFNIDVWLQLLSSGSRTFGVGGL